MALDSKGTAHIKLIRMTCILLAVQFHSRHGYHGALCSELISPADMGRTKRLSSWESVFAHEQHIMFGFPVNHRHHAIELA